MKILLISDTEEKFLWENWTKATADMLADVELVLSAGDLNHSYLEFIVTMLNVPLVYVRGNHDGSYDEEPPEGCEDAEGKVVEVECGTGSSRQKIRILGLGGSMRYRDDAADMSTENEMRARVRDAERLIRKRRLAGSIKSFISPAAGSGAGHPRRACARAHGRRRRHRVPRWRCRRGA